MEKIDCKMLHTMIRKFVSYGAPVQDDGEGPNKPDWPFFERLAGQDELFEWQMQEAAQRFHKYRNTQMARILKETGFEAAAKNVGYFLERMKQQGDAAMEIKKAQQARANKMATYQSKVSSSIHKGKDYAPLLQQMIDDGIEQAEIDLVIDRAQLDAAELERVARLTKTIDIKMVTDEWTNRWGKTMTTERVGLVFGYDPELQTALKTILNDTFGFPACKWDGRGSRMWTLKREGAIIQKAIDIIQDKGYYPSDNLIALLDTFDSTEVTQVKKAPIKDTNVILEKGSTLVMSWPFLKNPNERNGLLHVVKQTDGRKFRPDDKTWAISIAQAGDLIDRLNAFKSDEWNKEYTEAISVAGELVDAMRSIEQVNTYMEERAARIAISGAAALTDESVVAGIKEKFIGLFPDGLELYPFQYVGVQFAELSGGRCLIGDDMGIGKTIQAIAYAAIHPERWPVAVVCPANVKYNWEKEIKTWLPDANVSVIKKGKDTIPDQVDFLVINYDLIKKQRENLEDYGFDMVIFDESHYLKNKKAQRTQASLAFADTCESVLCLSGTAVTNRPIEFFTTLNLLRPAEFPNRHVFGVRYCSGSQQYIGYGKHAWSYDGASNTEELHNRTRDFCIRRLKKEVMAELPDKIRTIHQVEPSTAELRAYKETHDAWMHMYHEHKAHNSMPAGFVLNMLTDLRHECGRLKVASTIKWIDEYKEQNPDTPLVVFFHHKDVGVELMNELKKNYSVAGIVGGTPAETRQQYVDMFQEGKLDILCCSTLAAKEGITLTAADTVVFIEREWVPGWEEQAEDRINRIGQEADTVWATYISVNGTIDEKFDRVIEDKRQVVKAVLDGGDIEERQGIAAALIESMVEAGELPEEFKDAFKKSSKKKAKDVVE